MTEGYTAVDLEMTGLNAKKDKILELGAVRIRNGKTEDVFSVIVNPGVLISEEITALTGITAEEAADGAPADEALDRFFAFLGEDALIGHNVQYDYSFLKQWAVNQKRSFERSAVDTLKLARKFLPKEQKKDLESLCVLYGIRREAAHRALCDAKAAAELFFILKTEYEDKEPEAFLPKPLLYRAKRQQPATAAQKRYLERFAKWYHIEIPERNEAITRNEASRLVDRLIAQYGRLPKNRDIDRL